MSDSENDWDETDQLVLAEIPQYFLDKQDWRMVIWESAEHWLMDNWNAKSPMDMKIYGNTCPACEAQKTVRSFFSDECDPCPVYRKTGKDQCKNSPWMEVEPRILKYWKYSNAIDESEKCEMAQRVYEAVEQQYKFLVELALDDNFWKTFDPTVDSSED